MLFHRVRFLAYAVIFLATISVAAEGPEFTMSDPRGDDFGAGTIRYPSSVDFDKGDLDLIEFSAESGKKGTWFTARFAREIKSPVNRMSRAASIRLEDLLRFDFFNLNIDIYIDTDGRPGSGNINTVPGRRIEVHSDTAWEKAVILTPRPTVARSTMENYFNTTEITQREAAEGTLSRDQLRKTRQDIRGLLEEQFYFPDRINTNNRTIRFFVPKEFLGGPASPDWSYLVLVTGADPEPPGSFDFLNQPSRGLLQMPLTGGRVFESFQIDFDSDPKQPPIIDALLPTVEQQVALLSDFDAVVNRLAVLPGLRPSQPGVLPGPVIRPDRLTTAAPAPKPIPRTEPPPEVAPPQARPETTRPATATPPRRPTRVDETEMAAEPMEEAAPLPEVKPAAKKPAAETAPPMAKPDVDRLLAPATTKKRELSRTVAQRLRELQGLLDEGLITQEEFKQLRRKILEDL